MPTMPLIAVRSSTTPPCTGTLAPQTPLRPAAGVTGTFAALHAASTAATWPRVGGPDDRAGAGRRLRVERPDHRERPPVAARLRGRVRRHQHLGAGGLERAEQVGGDGRRGCRRAARRRRRPAR